MLSAVSQKNSQNIQLKTIPRICSKIHTEIHPGILSGNNKEVPPRIAVEVRACVFFYMYFFKRLCPYFL